MAWKRTYQLRHFVCTVCGDKQTASKYKGHTNNGHIKTMWCPVCNTEQDFVQYDSDRVRFN